MAEEDQRHLDKWTRAGNTAGQWGHMPLIPALGRQRQADFWVWGQPGLQSEIQDSQGYTEKPCLKKTKQQQQQQKPKNKQTNKKKQK
jgi:hypothetical protein